MDKYNPEAKCPKCGSDNVSSQFTKVGSPDTFGGAGTFTRVPFVGRHCHNCHYEWQEAPLDEKTSNANS